MSILAEPAASCPLPAAISTASWVAVCAAIATLLVSPPAVAREPMRLGPKPPPVPKRVVTLAPSLTETVLALGGRERIVGVTRYDDAPAVKDVPRVGGYSDPSVEAVIALHPDLVLCEPSPGNRAAVERMAALGAPILALPLTTQEEILDAMRVVGAALGLAERGEALARDTEARIARVRERARKLQPVKTMVVYDWEPLVVAGPGSFGDALLRDTGATNAAREAKGPYPIYSAELAMQAAPQVIIDASDVHDPPRERLLKLPGLRTARVQTTSPSLFHPGPRLGEAVEELFRLLHPESP